MINEHIFVDGEYLRNVSKHWCLPLFDPLGLFNQFVNRTSTEFRMTYYDAVHAEIPPSEAMALYWDQIASMTFCHLGFGRLQGEKRFRQKGVDTLIAADMISGAFRGAFKQAWLISGDADFVPVLEEVKRCGVMTGLIGIGRGDDSVALALAQAVDRFIPIEHTLRDSGPLPFRMKRYTEDGIFELFVHEGDTLTRVSECEYEKRGRYGSG